MALMNCPECNGTVSDKAVSCPHCGCPITPEQEASTIQFQGETINISNVLSALKDGDGFLAEAEMIDAYDETALPYSDQTTASLLKLAVSRYKQLYGTYPTELPPCVSEVQRGDSSPQSSQPHCPTCGSTSLTKIGAGSRAIDGLVFGRLSVEGKAQFRCNKCGYMW